MGLNKYELAKNILREHIGETWSVAKLKGVIIRKLASDERSVEGYLKMMREIGMIKEVAHMRFIILDG